MISQPEIEFKINSNLESFMDKFYSNVPILQIGSHAHLTSSRLPRNFVKNNVYRRSIKRQQSSSRKIYYGSSPSLTSNK